MSSKSSVKKISHVTEKDFHPFEIKIDKNRYPRRKGNKSRLYAEKIADDVAKLHDSEIRLNIVYENVRSYRKILDKRMRQKRPINYINRITFFQEMDAFDLEYENFCMRVYNYRETLRNFVSEFFGIQVFGYRNFIIDSKIRDLGLDKYFEKFSKNNLGEVMKNRKNITHRITEEYQEKKKKVSDKLEQQKERFDRVTKSVEEIMKIQDSVCKKIMSNM